jgi:hypothetical protein
MYAQTYNLLRCNVVLGVAEVRLLNHFCLCCRLHSLYQYILLAFHV